MQVAAGNCHAYMKLPNNRTRQKGKKKVFGLQHNGRFQVLFKDGKIWLRWGATVTKHPVLECVPAANGYGRESNTFPLPSRSPCAIRGYSKNGEESRVSPK